MTVQARRARLAAAFFLCLVPPAGVAGLAAGVALTAWEGLAGADDAVCEAAGPTRLRLPPHSGQNFFPSSGAPQNGQ